MIQFLQKAAPRRLGGVALLRLDFNTKDDWRMKAALPTIQLLLKHSRGIVIISHKGRPLGFQKEFSLARDAENLGNLLKRNIHFVSHFNFPEIKRGIAAAKPRSVFVLENLRFMPGEAANDPTFAKNLASLGDFYVNDAFAVSHRENASVSALPKLMPAYAGLGLQSEVIHLSKVMKAPKRPLIMIFGGAKMEDKLDVIKYFRTKADAFLMGGGLANTLLHLSGVNVGQSLYERDAGADVRALLKYKNLYLPIDFRMEGGAILDIGAKTERLYQEKIREAKTVVWNGPMGMFEKADFARGTNAVIKAVAENVKAFSLVGGGETVTALYHTGHAGEIGFVSTGGGAMLDFLAGKELPGLAALSKRAKNKK